MAIDPNIYALQISLSLDSAAAFQTLDTFEESLTSVEQSISDAAVKSLGQLDSMVVKIESSLQGLSSSIKGMGTESDQLAVAMAYAGSNVDELGDNVDEQIKNLVKARDYWEEIRDFNEEISDFAKNELDMTKTYIKSLDSLIKTITKKNSGHEREVDLVKSERPLWDSLINAAESFLGSNDKIEKKQRSIWSIMSSMLQTLEYYTKATENFVTTNYRWYGSQSEILQQAALLSAEYGILNDRAIEAYRVLGNLRVPKEELDKYAESIAMANRFLGVGIEQLGMYAFRMKQVKMDAAGLEDQILFASEAMRKFGLSAEDINRILSNTKLSAAEINFFFGQGSAEKYDQLRMVVAGLGKEAGYTSEQTEALFNTLMDPKNMMLFENAAGMSINTIEDLGAAFMKVGGRADDLTKQMEAAKVAGDQAQYLRLERELNAYAKSMGLGSGANLLMIRDLKAVADEMNINLATAEGYRAAMDALRQRAMNPFSEANEGLIAQLNLLRSNIFSLIQYAITPLADALAEVLKVVNWFAMKLASLLNVLGKVWKFFEDIPVIGAFFWAIRIGAGYVLLLVGSIIAFGAAISFLGGIMEMVYRGVVGFFDAIGRGLLRLGESVQRVMLPLLALGAAFMLTGAGAYLFAQSVSIIAQQGWAAIPALIGMVLAISILGAVLVGLAMLAQGPVALGLLAVSAALLAVGATVWMIGAGFKLMAESANILANAIINLTNSGAIGEFADQLLSASWKLLVAAPMLAAAAIILVPAAVMLGAAGLLLAVATSIFSFAIWSLGDAGVKFKEGMQSLLDGTVLMSQIDFGLLIVGAANLIKAGLILTAAAIFFVPAALAIGVAGAMLGYGLGLLSSGASQAAKINFEAMAANLLYGASILVWVGPVMFAAAVTLLPAGLTLAAAGLGLWLGALGVSKAADLLAGSGDKLLKASVDIKEAAFPLAEALLRLGSAAYAAILVGPALLVGSLAILPGATALWFSGLLIKSGAESIHLGSHLLYYGAVMLRDAAVLIIDYSDQLYIGATLLAGSAVILAIGASTLLGASGMLLLAGVAMLPAAISLYAGMFWMQGALSRLASVADKIDLFSRSMMMMASSFLILSVIDFGVLGDIADAGLSAVPKIDKFSNDLSSAASRLDDAVTKFQEPANRLVQQLSMVKEAISGIDLQGLNLEADVSQMGQDLEKYATMIESSAIRIEEAVNTRAIPAIDEANRSGVADIARSEAITTVKVMNETEDSRNIGQDELQTDLLHQLVSLVNQIVGNGENKTELSNIVGLLEAYLPEMTKKDSAALASTMNSWS